MATKKPPPGPKGNVLAGSLLEFMRDPLAFVEMCAKYGDVVRFRVANLNCYLVNNTDYIEDVLVAHSRSYIKGRNLRDLTSLIGNGLVLSEGEFWLRQRRLMQPAMHRERVAEYGKIMVEYAERLSSEWQVGATFDLHEQMTRLTMEIVCKSLFDADVYAEAKDLGEAMQVFVDKFVTRFGQLHLPDNWPTPANRRFHQALHRVNELLYGLIEQHRHEQGHRDLLAMLLAAQDDDGSRMTDQQVRDEIITMFIAGHETTALVLTWTWMLLAQHPEVEAKLQDEIADVLEGRRPSVGDIPRLTYADMVIKEVMRLYPPAWLITREVIHDCKVGDYDAPTGTQIIISQWVTQRDPRHFDQPEQFNPERWLRAGVQKGSKHTYLPFGAGARGCIGSSFALMETVLILTTVAQQYRMSLLPAHSIVPLASATLRPKYGLAVKLEKKSIAYDTITT